MITVKPTELTDVTFAKEVEQAKGVCLVYFWAEWVAPCRMAKPVVQALVNQYAGAVRVCALDTDAQRETTARLGITALPTFIIFRDGQPDGRRFIGVKSMGEIKEALDAALGQVPAGKVEPVAAADLVGRVKQGGVCVAFLYVKFCALCSMMEPVLADFAAKHSDKVRVFMLDIDDEPDSVVLLGKVAVPAVVIFKDGEEVGRVVGITSKGDFKAALEKTLAGK